MLLAVPFFLQSCEESKTEENTLTVEDRIEASVAGSEDQEAKPLTQITFEKIEHDFGKVKEGEKVTYTFKFTNTGQAPLVITDARASCGCTLPTWTKDPVQPGAEGKIEVQYDSAGKEGIISKTVHVFANTEPEETTLTIKVNVLKEKKLAGPFKDQG